MTYTIHLQRKTGTNSVDSIMVLCTHNQSTFTSQLGQLQVMFAVNNTLVSVHTLKEPDVIRAYIEYDLSKGE